MWGAFLQLSDMDISFTQDAALSAVFFFQVHDLGYEVSRLNISPVFMSDSGLALSYLTLLLCNCLAFFRDLVMAFPRPGRGKILSLT